MFSQTPEGVIVDRQQIQVTYTEGAGAAIPGFSQQTFPLAARASEGSWRIEAHYGYEVRLIIAAADLFMSRAPSVNSAYSRIEFQPIRE